METVLTANHLNPYQHRPIQAPDIGIQISTWMLGSRIRREFGCAFQWEIHTSSHWAGATGSGKRAATRAGKTRRAASRRARGAENDPSGTPLEQLSDGQP
jgi:hypothetical protein